MGKLLGAKIGGLHTLDDLGLLLMTGSPLISGAEPDKKLVQVPGADFLLDLSRSVDGRVHYLKRTIKMDLKCIRPPGEWHKVQSILENALQGQWLRCVFDDDPANFWIGLWEVSPQTRSKHYETFTITGTCNPYKYNSTAYDGPDWLWDDLYFDDDVICDEPTEIKSL